MHARRASAPTTRAAPTPAFAAVLVAAWLAAGCTLPSPSGGTPGTPGVTAPSSAAPSPTGPSRPFRPTPTPQPTFAVHRVEAGDTLAALAARYGTTIESLAYWNRARYPSLDPESSRYRPDRIAVGWELLVLPGAVVDPEDLPPASEPPEDGSGFAGPYPTLPPNGSAALVRRGPAGLDAVALTFDYRGGAGSGPGGAEAVLQWLQVNGVPATVFVAGQADAADPAVAAVLDRLARPDAVEAGVLVPADDAATLGATLEAADAALAPALGATTAPWVRPTDGTASAAALRAAGAAGWTWAIGWDADPGDGTSPASGGPIATDIVARVVSQARGGSIVRLQLTGARTLEALPGIVEGLAGVELRVAALDELLGLAAEE